MANSFLSNGLLGMGGLGGVGGAQPAYQSLLGDLYDPKAMQRAQMKQMLLGMGMGLMSQKGFGRGAELALAMGARAGDDYRQSALDAYRLKSAEEERAYQRERDATADERWQMQFDYNKGRQQREDARQNTLFDWQMQDRQQQEDMRMGQQNQVQDWMTGLEQQGGNLFSPEMQMGLRQQGIQGVDPRDTQKYERMQPLVGAGMYPEAFQQMTAEPVAPGAPTIQKFREVDPATGEPVEITVQWTNGQWVEIGRGPAFNPNSGVKIDNRQMGNIPPGYTVEYDAQDRPVRMSPIPGSPDAAKAAAAETAASNRREGAKRSADVVIEDIDRTLALIDTATIPATGAIGSVASMVPGTAAHDISQLVLGIRANIGFDRLQRMRDESPTGGALGQVAVQELQALQASLGSLAQSQTEEQFKQNLIRLRELYLDIVHGPGNRPAQAPQPETGGAEEWSFDENGNPVRLR